MEALGALEDSMTGSTGADVGTTELSHSFGELGEDMRGSSTTVFSERMLCEVEPMHLRFAGGSSILQVALRSRE